MSKSVDSGRLRHRVTFEQMDPDPEKMERDSDGEIVENWEPLFNVPQPTEITPMSGRELFAANAAQSKATHRFKVRYRREFETRNALRAIHRGTIYAIEAVIPDADSGRRYQTIFCSSGVREAIGA